MGVKRREETFFFNEKLFADAMTKLSPAFNCAEYTDFLLMYSITEGGTPPDTSTVQIWVQFLDQQNNVYLYEDGAFGLLLEGESSTPCNRAFKGQCIGKEMSIKIKGSGTLSTTNYYVVKVRVQFFRKEENG